MDIHLPDADIELLAVNESDKYTSTFTPTGSQTLHTAEPCISQDALYSTKNEPRSGHVKRDLVNSEENSVNQGHSIPIVYTQDNIQASLEGDIGALTHIYITTVCMVRCG